MTLITSGELDAIRTIANTTLTETATIRRATVSTPDGMGGQTESLATVAANVACRVRDLHSVANALTEVAERMATQAAHVIVFSASTTIQVEDQVEIGSRTFRVKFVRARSLQTVKQVLALEIES